MPLEFRFRERRTPSGRSIWRPLIPVRLEGPGGGANAFALLDSGADTSLLPRVLAEYLGLRLSSDTPVVRGIGGEMAVRTTSLDLVFRSPDEFHRLPRVPCLVPLAGWAPIVLGREALFDAFRVEFRLRENLIVLTRVAA